jgi:hypothetical protein
MFVKCRYWKETRLLSQSEKFKKLGNIYLTEWSEQYCVAESLYLITQALLYISLKLKQRSISWQKYFMILLLYRLYFYNYFICLSYNVTKCCDNHFYNTQKKYVFILPIVTLRNHRIWQYYIWICEFSTWLKVFLYFWSSVCMINNKSYNRKRESEMLNAGMWWEEREKEALCTVWCKWRVWDFHPHTPNVTHFNIHINCIVVSVNMLHAMLFQTKAVACSMKFVLKLVCVRIDNVWSEQCEWC